MAANANFMGACVPGPSRAALLPAPLCSGVSVRRAEIGKAFTNHYYQLFDDAAQRVNLQGMYIDKSMLTFETEQFMGMQAIMTKLTVPLHQLPPMAL